MKRATVASAVWEQLGEQLGLEREGERRAPGPRELPIVGSALALRRDPLGFLSAAAARYGRVFGFHVGTLKVHVLADPDAIKHVLADHHRNFTKSWGYDKVRPVLGNGLLTSEGETWKRQRRLMTPTFHHQMVAGFATDMVEATSALVDEWGPRIARGEPFDVAAEMMALALRIVGRTLFGVDVRGATDGIGRAMTVLVEGANRRIIGLGELWERLPTRDNRAFEGARRYLDDLVFGLIAQRRREGLRGDLLSMLLAARDEDGAPMPDAQVRDEVLTLLLAGHETTANAMAWAFYLLGRHPAAFARLREELVGVLGDRLPTVADVPALQYTAMVVQEAMRLYPPGWVLARTVEEDDEVGGYHVPAGSVVGVCPYLVHRDPALWDAPERFEPLRFTRDEVSRRHKFAYLPFSAGPRACIGKGFAMMEMTLLLAVIAQRVRLDLEPHHPVIPDAEITLRPRYGIQVRARPV